MPRLPNDGLDTNVWGQLLNEYLLVSHDAAGKIKIVPANLGVPMDSGEIPFDRRFLGSAAAGSSGELHMTFFTASKTETITQLAMYSAGTAAATVTLIRWGVYSVAANGDLTLVASTANDATLFIATNTRYVKTLTAPWSKTAGQLYAVGHLVVATTVPSVYGSTSGSAAIYDAVWARGPRMGGVRTGQTDLPASIVAANVSSSRRNPYFEALN